MKRVCFGPYHEYVTLSGAVIGLGYGMYQTQVQHVETVNVSGNVLGMSFKFSVNGDMAIVGLNTTLGAMYGFLAPMAPVAILIDLIKNKQ